MSLIETLNDVNNTFLSRRELVLNFKGIGGKLKKLEAIDMVTKEFKLDGKLVIPINLKNHVGKSLITGTFYVYEDENLAKKQVNPVVFSRLEKSKKGSEQKEEKPEPTEAEAKQEEETEEPAEKKEEKSEEKKRAVEEKAE